MITKQDLDRLADSIDLSEDAESLHSMAASLDKLSITDLVSELLFVHSQLSESINTLSSILCNVFDGVIEGKTTITIKNK